MPRLSNVRVGIAAFFRRRWLPVVAIVAAIAILSAGVAAHASKQVYDASSPETKTALINVEGALVQQEVEDGDSQSPYSVQLSDGSLLPLTFDAGFDPKSLDQAIAFSGSLVVPNAVAQAAGITVGDSVDTDSDAGKTVLSDLVQDGDSVQVLHADLTAGDTTPTIRPEAHHLYVAAINDLGVLSSDSVIEGRLARARSYWVSQSNGFITSFDRVGGIKRYASQAATTANGCGLGKATAVWTEARQQFPGVDFTQPGNHLMVIIPGACQDYGHGTGIGTVGESINSGGRTIVTGGNILTQVAAHELGHNFSLQHANAAPSLSSSNKQPYYGMYSPMGFSIPSSTDWQPPALDTMRRAQLQIAKPGEIAQVTASRDLTLRPRSDTSGLRGLEITDPRTRTTYVAQYRSGTGVDAHTAYAHGLTLAPYVYRPGVTIMRIESDHTTTNMGYVSGSSVVTSWIGGQVFSAGSLHIAVRSVSPSAGAKITIIADGTKPQAGAAPTLLAGRVSIKGVAKVGRQLGVTRAASMPEPSHIAYTWYANGKVVGHAPTLKLANSMAKKRIVVKATESRPGFHPVMVGSAATAAVHK